MRTALRFRLGSAPAGVLVLLLSATFTARAADPALLALAPPDANFVLGVRVADLAATPFALGETLHD